MPRKPRRTRLRGPEAIDPLEIAISEPDPFSARVAQLIDENVADLNAIVEIERRTMFSGSQSENLWSVFNAECDWLHIQRQHATSQLAKEFELCARWHAWRQRPHLAERYQARAFKCQQIVSEKENGNR